MYIFKNAYLSIIRGKGRNILIGIIITAVTIGACIAITINKSGTSLVENYKNNNPLEVSFNLDPMALREASDEEKESFSSLTEELINKIGSSKYIIDYYYTLETSLNSNDIEAIDYNQLFNFKINEENNGRNQIKRKGQNGDFRLTAYSDISYNNDFISGTKKLIDGEMITKDNTDSVIVISQELAEENDIKVGDKIKFYSSSNEETIYEFTVLGIYEDNSSTENNNFINMNAMNSRNQILTNLESINKILENETTSDTQYKTNGLSSKFYINNEDYNQFLKEATNLGLSSYYQATNNESEITKTLEPISNISKFSFTFLIVILIVGAIVLSILNFINIRDRKYEIGVLRAIGMTKAKVTIQLITETFIVALVSLIIGTTAGVLLSEPVANSMLKNEIQNIENETNQIENNFGGENFERPSFSQGNRPNKVNQIGTIEYVDSLNIKIDILTIIQLLGVSIFLTVISSTIAIVFVNKYQPNKILQNRG